MTRLFDPGPSGFYQLHLTGNKSGRRSPREAQRGSRRSEVYAAHGLIDQGEANPRQGQLFDRRQIPARSLASSVRDAGAPPPLASSRPGYMPGLEGKNRNKQIVTGLNKFQRERISTGADRGTGAPIAEALADKQKYYDASPRGSDWYTDRAPAAIDRAAMRTGSTSTEMTRAVAITSPRTAWDQGVGQEYRMPNIESAEAVVRTAKSLPADVSREDAIKAGRNIRDVTSLPETMGKAVEHLTTRRSTDPIDVPTKGAQKVPNFEQSLQLGHADQQVRKAAAGSYVVDAWDLASIGVTEKLTKMSDPGYAVAHHIGTRSALKNRELPPIGQARTWEAIRGDSGYTAPKNGLFVERGRKLVPNPDALPTQTKLSGRQFDSVRKQAAVDRYNADLELFGS